MRRAPRLFHAGAVPLLLLLLTLRAVSALAQQQDMPVIDIDVGSLLELKVDALGVGEDFSWILTKDHRFLTAQRTPYFQTRQSIAGAYLLDVNVQDTNRTQTTYFAFALNVHPLAVNATNTPRIVQGQALKAVLNTTPTARSGVIHLPTAGGIVKIDPGSSAGQIVLYSMDLDTSVDSDGDGNPGNDADTKGTYSEQSGSPIYFYVRPKPVERAIRLTVTDVGGASTSTDLSFAFDGNSQSGNAASAGDSGIIQATTDNLTMTFHASLPQNAPGRSNVLMEWDFGDQTKSLLDNPVHTYGKEGEYAVTLTVRNMVNGQITATDTIGVHAVAPTVSANTSSYSASSVASSASSSQKAGATLPGSTMAIATVGGIILLLLAVAIGLYMLLHWIKRRTAGSLQQTIEKMEGQLFTEKKPAATVLDAATVPLQITKRDAPVTATQEPEEISEREKQYRDFQTQERTQETPIVDAGPVPAWLQKASSTSEPATPAQESPAAAIQADVTPAPPMPSPPPTPAVPDWLSPQKQPTAPPTPTPSDLPTQARAPEAVQPSPTIVDPAPAVPLIQTVAPPPPAPPQAPVATQTDAQATAASANSQSTDAPSVPAPLPSILDPEENTPLDDEDFPDWLKDEKESITAPSGAEAPIQPDTATPSAPFISPEHEETVISPVLAPTPQGDATTQIQPPRTPTPAPVETQAPIMQPTEPLPAVGPAMTQPAAATIAEPLAKTPTVVTRPIAHSDTGLTPTQKRRLRRKRAMQREKLASSEKSEATQNTSALTSEPQAVQVEAQPLPDSQPQPDPPIAFIRAESVEEQQN